MLKKVSVEQLRLGMFIHTLGGSWIHHPFWRSSFMLDAPADLAQLRGSCVPEVWINLSRGLDVLAPQEAAAQPPEEALPPTAPEPLPPLGTAPTPLGLEVENARRLCNQARAAVQDMFQQARMGQALNMEASAKLVDEISDSLARNPDALISMARLKTADDYTYMHSVAVSALMTALARQLGYNPTQVQQAALAGLLHDIGKARSDIEVLNKPGALTDAEFEHIKQHPVTGYKLLKNSVDDTLVLDACLHHHERLDGKGYPGRLKGEEISELARMAAICDVYDAITSDRPYKKGWSPAVALQRMAQWCGDHLDERLFRAFVKTLGVYPVGSLVRLSNQELAIVFAPCAENSLVPKVVRFYDVERQRLLDKPLATDLRLTPELNITQREEPSSWPFTNLDGLWQNACRSLLSKPAAANHAPTLASA